MAKTKITGNGGALKLNSSYMFRGKDPTIDELRTMTLKFAGTNRLTNAAMKKVELAGGPSVGCQRGWYFKDVLKPRNYTAESAGRAMGKKRVWVNA